MSELPYRKWSLIPGDAEPESGRPTVSNPPQMTTLALDPGASLLFELARAPGPISVRLSATALSAESRPEDFLRVYGGEAEGPFRQVPTTWARSQDGMHMVFTATVFGAGPCMKLHLPKGPTLVVTGAEFSDPTSA